MVKPINMLPMGFLIFMVGNMDALSPKEREYYLKNVHTLRNHILMFGEFYIRKYYYNLNS